MSAIWIVAGVEAILLLMYCAYLAWYYAAKHRTPLYVMILAVTCWFLGLMVIILIPLDIITVIISTLIPNLNINDR